MGKNKSYQLSFIALLLCSCSGQGPFTGTRVNNSSVDHTVGSESPTVPATAPANSNTGNAGVTPNNVVITRSTNSNTNTASNALGSNTSVSSAPSYPSASQVDMAKIQEILKTSNFPFSNLMTVPDENVALMSMLVAFQYHPPQKNKFQQSVETWIGDLKKQIQNSISRDRCASYEYPTIDMINKRRKFIVKNEKMRDLICLPGSPFAELCPTFAELILMDDKIFTVKLVTDQDFAKKVHTIDSLLIMVKKPENGTELFYNIFQQYSLSLTYEIEEAILNRKQVDTVFIGDSLMMLFKDKHEKTFKNALFMGIGGDRIDNLLNRININLAQLKPKNVVLSIGGNDLMQDCDRTRIQNDRYKIITFLTALGVKNIYWLSLPPVSVQKFKYAQIILEENLKIAALPGIKYLDSYTPMVIVPGLVKPQYFLDGVHLPPIAYEEIWVPLLKAQGL